MEKNIRGAALLQRMEILNQQIANAIEKHKDQIDCIDMASARLVMRAVIVKEGIILKGEDALVLIHYPSQTWDELKEFYWRKSNAACSKLCRMRANVQTYFTKPNFESGY